MQARKKFGTIDEYIKTFPPDVQKTLERLRHTIRKAVPEAEEVISYQMPAFKLKGNLVYFAAFKRSEEHTSELQSRRDLVCRLLLEKKKNKDKKRKERKKNK